MSQKLEGFFQGATPHRAWSAATPGIATAAPGVYRRPALVVELDDEDRAFLLSLALLLIGVGSRRRSAR